MTDYRNAMKIKAEVCRELRRLGVELNTGEDGQQYALRVRASTDAQWIETRDDQVAWYFPADALLLELEDYVDGAFASVFPEETQSDNAKFYSAVGDLGEIEPPEDVVFW